MYPNLPPLSLLDSLSIYFKRYVAGVAIGDDRGGGGIVAVQSFDLIGIANRVSFQERNGALVVRLGVFHDKLVGIDNGGSLAALPDIAAQLQRLFAGQPIGRGEALTHSEIGRAHV